MILSMYDFRRRLPEDVEEPLGIFIEECLLLDGDGIVEVHDETILNEKEV